jgi:hypothetical protein
MYLMTNNESLGSGPNKLKRLKTGLKAGALTVGLILPASAGAETKKHSPKAPESLAALITTKEKRISNDIARQTPITFKNSLAHYHSPGKLDFFIDNPLTAIIKEGDKKVKLLGYIEPKGGPDGPDVVLFPYDKRTTSLSPNQNDPVNGQPESQVIFPSPNGGAFDPNNPVDPLTGNPLHDRFGPDERILVGGMYTSQTK